VGRFKKYTLPTDYVLQPLKHALKEGTGIRAFTFLLDFCVSVDFRKWGTKYPNFRDDGKLDGKVARMGKGLPLQKTKLIAYLHEMEMCLIQVIDRIASTQLGASHEKAIEYVKHIETITILKRKSTHPDAYTYTGLSCLCAISRLEKD
jgi:hypothetical protein